MNITITQDNSRIETLGSNGASIIQKLYDLAIDSNNTLTLRGNISSTSAYGDQVDYLNNTYGPDFIVSATNKYLKFEDANAERVCAQYFGDGTGCTISDLANANFATTVNGVDFGTAFKNAGVVKFNEFKYCTGVTDTSVSNTQPFRNNHTLEEFTLPTSCKTISAYTFCGSSQEDSIAPKINGIENITYIQNFGFWGWGSGQNDEDVVSANRMEIDWRNINGVWNSMYAASNAFKGNVILPKYPTDAWTSSRDFSIFTDGRGQYITKIVFPETFICRQCQFSSMYSCNTFIFLTQTPCTEYISMWRNQNWGVGDPHLYVPRSLYDTMDSTVLADTSYSEKQYTSSIKISYGPTPEPLDNYANISDTNKDELVSYGCTATGSTGNWTIKAPGEA